MQIFTCPVCEQAVFFSNLRCGCGSEVVFDPAHQRFTQDAPHCANRSEIDCNWQAEHDDGLCRSCHMTKVIPDTFHDTNIELWKTSEKAKRWVLANLSRWGWFTANDPNEMPRFHMLAEETEAGPAKVIMGHDNGLITINVAEADPAERAKRREDLSERLRTMTAHFRHEIAHFLFVRLSHDAQFLSDFRELFGDERTDYGAAISSYYEKGAPEGYGVNHITRYATSHPHEDWAETTAHVMHLTDILDSASAVKLQADDVPDLGYDAYRETDSKAVIHQALELSIALNHMNRSMGLQDIYPFVVSPNVRKKMRFAHKWLFSGASVPSNGELENAD